MDWFLDFLGIDFAVLWGPVSWIINFIVSIFKFIMVAFGYITAFNPILGALFSLCIAVLAFYGLLKLIKAIVPIL